MTSRIAVVAAACEYPDARTPEGLWQNVLCRRKAFRQIPPVRLRLEDYAVHNDFDPDSIYGIEAAVLEGYYFPREEYCIPLTTYDSADLAHWLALDVASRAVSTLPTLREKGDAADATVVVVANSLTGEFSRASLLRYRWPYVERAASVAWTSADIDEAAKSAFLSALEQIYKAPFPAPNEESLAGGLSNTIAGRIANYFGFRGGAFTVDGACASSLVAVMSACEKLVLGDARYAVVGAVDLSLDPFELVGFARNGALSRTSMRVFDRDSDGFWPGEGCGFMVLTTEEEATAMGWKVLGWICGWGMSTDGHGGLTRPTVEGQKLALKRAYDRAGIDVTQMTYFEAHGTGTPTGDPVEIQALAEFLQENRSSRAIPIGSIKANIGHTKAAAGLAGLLKALAVVSEGIIPPSTGVHRPNPMLDEGWAARYLRLPLEAEQIEFPGCALAGVSGFGFGGINCHLIVQGPGRGRSADTDRTQYADISASPEMLFRFSGDDREALESTIERVSGRVQSITHSELADLAGTLHAEVADRACRAYAVAGTPRELFNVLEALLASLHEDSDLGRATGDGWGWSTSVSSRPKIVLLFPGQGQSFRLNVQLWKRRFPSFGTPAERLVELLNGDHLDTAVVQPLVAEIGIAGLMILRRMGLVPNAVLGHSVGELVALHAARGISEEALRCLTSERGRLMKECGAGRGAMASFKGQAERIVTLAKELDLDIACHNGPQRLVLSGTPEVIHEALERANTLELEGFPLPTSVAFHSRQMAAARAPFQRKLNELAIGSLAIQVISTVTGAPIGKEDLKELLVAQLTDPVLFEEAIGAAGTVDLFLEVGAGHVLADLATENSTAQAKSLCVFGDSMRPFHDAIGACWMSGAVIDTAPLFDGIPQRHFDILRKPAFLQNPCESIVASGLIHRSSTEVKLASPINEPILNGAGSRSCLEVITELIAASAGLSRETISPDFRLLTDLHLNSIRARQLVASAARQVGLEALPFNLSDIANASVSAVAEQLEKLRAKSKVPDAAVTNAFEPAPTGVANWLRIFTHDWMEDASDIGSPEVIETQFITFGSYGNFGDKPIPEFAEDHSDKARRAAFFISTDDSDASLEQLLLAGKAVASNDYNGLLILQDAPRCGGFARSLAKEYPEARICVVHADQLSSPHIALAFAEYESLSRGFSEVRYGLDGRRYRRVLGLVPSELSSKVAYKPGPDDVVLITGGGKGIGAEIASHLGRRSGCRIALVGRSPRSAQEVHTTLERLTSAGIESAYVAADLTDREAAIKAITSLEAQLGSISVVIHGAGVNLPKPVRELSLDDLLITVRSKVVSLDHVLEGLIPGQLKLLVAQSSIIGELGLEGEAHYAVANEWLNGRLVAHRRRDPGCACIPICWTAWRTVGMAANLAGVQDFLAQSDTRPIETTEALEALDVLIDCGDSVPVVVTGRYGRRYDPIAEGFDGLHFRFLECPRIYYPGVELIAEATISSDTDLYLLDHAPFDVPIFPLVMVLEAMAQGACALTGHMDPPSVERLHINQPIVLGWGEQTTIRVALLAQLDGTVEAQVRCVATGFAVAHFEGRLTWPTGEMANVSIPTANGEACSAEIIYDGLVFHGPLFQRVDSYPLVSSRRCVAITRCGPVGKYYSDLLPSRVFAGDPALRDAALHCLQACVPHNAVLPAEVGAIRLGQLNSGEAYTVVAHETWSNGNEYLYDIDIATTTGQLVEQWTDVRLQPIRFEDNPAADKPKRLALPLLVPLVERMASEEFGESDLAAGLSCALTERALRTESALRAAIGEWAQVRHAADGEPLVDGAHISLSHTDFLTLAIASRTRRIACDVAAPTAYDDREWRLMLGDERFRFADLLSTTLACSLQQAGSYVWVVSECLEKLGVGFLAFAQTGAVVTRKTELGWRVTLSTPQFQVTSADFVMPDGCQAFVGLALAPRFAGPKPSVCLPGGQPHALSEVGAWPS